MKKIPFPQYHIIILIFHPIYCRGYRVVVGFTAIYVIQHYVINFVSELRQVVVPISSTNKTDRHDILTEILLKVALNITTLTLYDVGNILEVMSILRFSSLMFIQWNLSRYQLKMFLLKTF